MSSKSDSRRSSPSTWTTTCSGPGCRRVPAVPAAPPPAAPVRRRRRAPPDGPPIRHGRVRGGRGTRAGGLPRAAIHADVIVGFPTEDQAAWERSISFVRSLDPAGLHVFRYSERPGTPATRMAGQVPEPERRRQRAAELLSIAAAARRRFAAGAVGLDRRVLIEQPHRRVAGSATPRTISSCDRTWPRTAARSRASWRTWRWAGSIPAIRNACWVRSWPWSPGPAARNAPRATQAP